MNQVSANVVAEKELVIAIPSYPYSLRKADSERHYARICCTSKASELKQETCPAGEWQLVDAVQLQCLRSQAKAGNLAYGTDSHWIERTYTSTPMRA